MIEKFKSGFLPPGDIPFEDLSSLDNMSGRATINIFDNVTKIFSHHHYRQYQPGHATGNPVREEDVNTWYNNWSEN